MTQSQFLRQQAADLQTEVDDLKARLRLCPQTEVPELERRMRDLQRRVQRLYADAGDARRREDAERMDLFHERFIRAAKARLPQETFAAIVRDAQEAGP